MTKVELVARALAASRTGQTVGWRECRADARLALARLGQEDAFLTGPGFQAVELRPRGAVAAR